MDKRYKKILLDMAESTSLNEKTAEEYLASQGIDVQYYVEKGFKEIRRKEFLEKAKANIEKHQILVEKAIQKLRDALPEVIPNVESAIRLKNPAFHFRNLQDLDESQLKEILNDVEILNMIDSLEQPE